MSPQSDEKLVREKFIHSPSSIESIDAIIIVLMDDSTNRPLSSPFINFILSSAYR